MSYTRPRIVVSRATFESEESSKSVRSKASTTISSKSNFSEAIIASTPSPQSPQLRWHQSAIFWALELVWCLFSIILLMGLVMVLSAFDNRALPDLPLGLTLNTIVAILATASRAVTVFLIGQGICQLKWNQYVGVHKPLVNLQVFDEASRGPWGSVQMVFRTRGNLLALLASLLIVTSLASSTLTQSAIAYTTRLVADEGLAADVQYCKTYPNGSIHDDDRVTVDFLNRFQTAAFGAVFNNIDRKWPDLEPRCQSAECRWPPFQTLAVCYEARNVSDKLDFKSRESPDTGRKLNTASLINDTVFMEEEIFSSSTPVMNITFLEAVSASPGSTDTFPRPRTSMAFETDDQALRSTFSQLLMIYSNPRIDAEKAKGRYRAVEVLMHFCVRTLEVKVEKGESSITSVGSHTQITDSQSATMTTSGVGDEGYFELSSKDGKESFRVLEYVGLEQVEKDFGRAFSGYYTDMLWAKQQGELARQIGINMFQGVILPTKGQPNGTAPEEVDKRVWKNLEQVFDTVATSMTSYLRESGLEKNGTALRSETFVEVRWEWLTMVAAQVVLSIVFLLSVVIGTARLGVDVVKSSNMAELFAFSQSGCDHCHRGTGSATRNQAVVHGGIKTEVGKDVEAMLRERDGGWRLEMKLKDLGV